MQITEEPSITKHIKLNVNGTDYPLEIESRATLAEALRENLGLTGTKVGCNRAECGSCTVVMDGKAVYSCTYLAVDAQNKKIETVEGLSKGGKMHPLQEMFMDEDALQCGYCIPGILMSLKALIDKPGKFDREDVRMAMSGNYCRCGAYPNMEKVALDILNR